MTAIQGLELVAVALALAALLLLTHALLRRRAISRNCPVVLCALRREGQPRWRIGLGRLAQNRYEWFPMFAVSFQPEFAWPRGSFELGAPLTPDAPVPGMTSAVVVQGQLPDGGRCDFAFDRATYTGVRSWAESAPPGQNVNVA